MANDNDNGNWDEMSGTDMDPVNGLDNLRKRKLAGVLAGVGDVPGGRGGRTPDDGGEDDHDSASLDDPEAVEAASHGGGGGTLANHIEDDAQQGKNRGGSPAGAVHTDAYSDPAQARLKDLMDQRAKLDQPAPKPSLKKTLIRSIAELAPTLAAAKFGGMGGAVGANEGYEAGVKRRHQVEDLATQNKLAAGRRLSDQIEEEQRGISQRTFQHGENEQRNRVQEEGMNNRATIAANAQTGQTDRLVAAMNGRKETQQAGFDHADDTLEQRHQNALEEEDNKQGDRMQLNDAKMRGAQSMARLRQALGPKIPPLVAKSFDAFQTSQSRANIMQENYDKAIKFHDQQAMLSLLANHLGMTMGLQQNARITQSIIDEAKKSGYLDERVEAHFDSNGYMTGVVLTPRQMKSMVDLAGNRLTQDSRKVEEMENYFGVQGHTRPTPKLPGDQQAAGSTAGTGGAGGAGAASSPSAAAKPAAHKAGEKVSYKGKDYTIKAIRPDGSYELQ